MYLLLSQEYTGGNASYYFTGALQVSSLYTYGTSAQKADLQAFDFSDTSRYMSPQEKAVWLALGNKLY